MAFPQPKPATYEDLFDLPENLVGEIVNGRLVTHPRPSPKHAIAYSVLGFELGNPFGRGRGGPGGWWILDEPEIHLDSDILIPDIAGWRRERMPKPPETAWFPLRPTGCAKSSRPAPPSSTAPRSFHFMPGMAFRTHGWSIPTSVRWKYLKTVKASGCCSPCLKTTRRSASSVRRHHLRPFIPVDGVAQKHPPPTAITLPRKIACRLLLS